MPIKSGIFNSVNGDRKYDAGFFAEYFATFIANGVFPNPSTCFQVVTNDDMSVNLKEGPAWINGYFVVNDADYNLALEVADGVLNRIDRVVLQLNYLNREITPIVKKGAFASVPVAPVLQRDTDIHEIALADVYISNGALSISQANITDLRLNTELCGIVHGVVDQADTTTLFNQYLDWYTARQAEYDVDFIGWTDAKKVAYDTWYLTTTDGAEDDVAAFEAQFQADFTTWFDDMKDQLSVDAAGNLQLQLDSLAGAGRTTETVKQNADDIVTLKIDVAAAQDALSGEIASHQLSQDLNIIDLAVNLETLKASMLTGVVANIFIETFLSLNDITLSHGVFDTLNKRVYL